MLNARDTDWLQGFGQECDGHWDKETILAAGGQSTLALEADHEGSASSEPPSVHIVEQSDSLHILTWNRATGDKWDESQKKKKNLVGNRCKFNLQLIGMTFGSGWGMCQPLWFLCLAWYMAAGTIFSFSFTGMLGLHCAVQFGKEEQGPWRHCSQDFIFSPHLLHDFTVRGIRFYVFFTPESSGPWLWQPSWNCWRGTRILL